MSPFTYPPPRLVVEPDPETLKAQRRAEFVAVWDEFRADHPSLALPQYNVETIAHDPAVVGVHALASADFYLIGRTNEVAQAAVLVDYARDDDLDLHGLATLLPGFPNGIVRHPEESDAAYAARILEARAGSSAAGPDEWWLSHARAADPRVRSIGLDYRGQGMLDVFVLATDNGGIADAAMLEAIAERLMRTDVRPRNVTVRVLPAVIEQVAIIADIWLLPEAADSRLDDIRAAARHRHALEQALDIDLTRHYVTRLLDAGDVYRIDIVSPTADLLASPQRAYALGPITLNLRGRAR